jgi:CheY-like chemotaxis protein
MQNNTLPTNPASPQPALRILVVEDNPVNQHLFDLMLQRLGHQPDLVPDGLAAIVAQEAKHYQLILMDVHMPQLDGLAATRRIRSLAASIPQPYIVALTASVMEAQRQACFDAGMDDFLSKPIDFGALRAVIEKVMALAQAAS